MKIRKPSK